MRRIVDTKFVQETSDWALRNAIKSAIASGFQPMGPVKLCSRNNNLLIYYITMVKYAQEAPL